MFGAAGLQRNQVSEYARVGVETGVSGADPHRLILMLFDGALMCVASAKRHMEQGQGQIGPKGENISKAINIIANGLKASLNTDVGGELAERLGALYEYMCERLLFANMTNSTAPLNEVHRLLDDLKGAWEQIGTAGAAEAQSQSAS
jgi:flagellar protein FliS